MNNFEDVFKKIKIMSCDTEILKDYFSFGFKVLGPKRRKLEIENLKYYGDNKYIYECINDNDCIKFASFYSEYLKNNTVQIYYNAQFDECMIDILLNEVKNNNSNIISTMREKANLICSGQLNYWKNKERQLTKDFCIIDAPTVGGNVFHDRKNDIIRPKCSLKKIQKILSNKSLKFDFTVYKTIEQIKKDKIFDLFIEYSLHDLDSLELYILTFCNNVFENRFHFLGPFNVDPIANYKMIFNNDTSYLFNYMSKVVENNDKKIER